MKQITMVCTLMFDIGDKEKVDIAKTRIIDLVNKTLQQAGLDSQPQILWNAPTPVTSITDKDFDRDPIWSELRDDFTDDGWIHIDAWIGSDDDIDGRVIARINNQTAQVIYLDERAKTDANAQDIIMRNVWKIAK